MSNIHGIKQWQRTNRKKYGKIKKIWKKNKLKTHEKNKKLMQSCASVTKVKIWTRIDFLGWSKDVFFLLLLIFKEKLTTKSTDLFFRAKTYLIHVFVCHFKKSINRPFTEPIDCCTINKCWVHTNAVSVKEKNSILVCQQ